MLIKRADACAVGVIHVHLAGVAVLTVKGQRRALRHFDALIVLERKAVAQDDPDIRVVFDLQPLGVGDVAVNDIDAAVERRHILIQRSIIGDGLDGVNDLLLLRVPLFVDIFNDRVGADRNADYTAKQYKNQQYAQWFSQL